MSWTQKRARLAALSRYRSADDPVVADATRDLAAERLEIHIRQVIDAVPAFTNEQRDKLTAAIWPSSPPSSGGGAAA